MKWVFDAVLTTMAFPMFFRLKSRIASAVMADSGKQTAIGPGLPSDQLDVRTWDVLLGDQNMEIQTSMLACPYICCFSTEKNLMVGQHLC